MKIVSFKVAKAIKEAGYPQGAENTAYYNENGVLIKPFVYNGGDEIADAPTYLDAWLWLWREKNIQIQNEFDSANIWPIGVSISYYADPEEAIEAAIEYLADNDLIK